MAVRLEATTTGEPMAKCSSTTRNGQPCKNKALPGGDTCVSHQPNSPVGRPTRFTPEVRERLLQAVRAGVYMASAAAYAGVHIDTLDDWLRHGRTDRDAGCESDFAAFSEGMERAAVLVEIGALANITAAAANDWRAAAWLVERRYPERYAKRDHREHETHPTRAVAVANDLLDGRQPVDVPRPVRQQILELLRKNPTDHGQAAA